MTKEEMVTSEVKELHSAIKAFVEACPEFVGDTVQVKRVAIALANLEMTLHNDFGCWELGLPTGM